MPIAAHAAAISAIRKAATAHPVLAMLRAGRSTNRCRFYPPRRYGSVSVLLQFDDRSECASSTGSIRGSQPDGKGRAFAKGAGDVEPAAMAVEHVLDDRQAETGAPQLSRSGVVDPVEALGQAR